MADLNPTDLAAAEQADEKAQRDAAADRRIEEDDIKWLMDDKRGRRIAHRILSRGAPHQPTFNPNALVMAFAEGKRSEAALLTAQLIALCPEKYLQMLKEHRPK